MTKRSNILRRKLGRTTALAGAIIAASPAAAQQMGNFGTVQSQVGPVTVTHNGNSLDVAASGGAIVNWNSFDVATGDTARFRNAGGAQAGEIAILNRVTGTRASRIDGTLTSDANVSLYLVNSNGMVFGSGASVTVGSLTASTLDVTDADFLDGTNSLGFSSSDKGGKLDMGAAVRASGDLVLIGDDVAIAGNLEAQRDLGLIVAGAVTVQRAAGSPLKFTLTRGSRVAELQTSGSLTGRNVAIGAAADGSVTNRLLAMDSVVTATGVAVTDKGINLVAGGGQSTDMVTIDASATGELTLQSTGRFASAKGITGASNYNLWLNDLSAQESVRLKAVTGLDFASLEVAAGDIELRQFYGSSGLMRASGAIDIYGESVRLYGDINADRLNIFSGGDLQTAPAQTMNIDVNTLYVEGSSIDLRWTNLSADAANFRGDFVYLSNGGTFNIAGDLTIDASANASFYNVNAGHIRLSAEYTTFYGALATAQLDLFGGKVEQDRRATLDVGVLSGSLTGAVALAGNNRIGSIAGLSAASLSLNTASALSLSGVNNFSGNVSVKTGGDLVLGSGTLTGNQVSLAAAGTFQNFAGAGAVSAADRWAIYLASPLGHSFGGLDSGNTAIWAGDATSRPIGGLTGNRYVFAYAPTLTFTARDLAKVYGEDGAAQLATSYAVAGLHPGVSNAFRGDTLADVVSGTPLLSSTGTAATAKVTGGPYAIDIGQGSLVSTAGYGLAFAAGGMLTVTPRLISATAHAGDKTYDGTDLANGSLSLTGLLFGDEVTASGLFRFSDKNAGMGKLVTISDTRLGGADAANYQLELPAPVLASILRKQVQVSVAADDKTYDQTLATTGRVTSMVGIVSGDNVAFAGGTFAFLDKNAGNGKVVTVSDLRFGGADAGNYDFTAPVSTTASILPKHVTVGVMADSKTYDGTTLASGRITTTDGIYAGDQIFFTSGDFAFVDKNAGADKQVSVSGIAASGADSANYVFAVPLATTAEIHRKRVDVTATIEDKLYDGTTTAQGTITSLDGIVAGDELHVSDGVFAFGDANAGDGKAVSVAGLRLSGRDAENYAIEAPGLRGNILKRTVTVRAADLVRAPWEIGDPLMFDVISGALLPGDAFSGALQLVATGTPGRYRIDQGSLSLSGNYAIVFEPGSLTLTGGTPAGYYPSRLYQEVELGGRTQALHRDSGPITWTAPLHDCRDDAAEPCR